jgi:hypothetical protein
MSADDVTVARLALIAEVLETQWAIMKGTEWAARGGEIAPQEAVDRVRQVFLALTQLMAERGAA